MAHDLIAVLDENIRKWKAAIRAAEDLKTKAGHAEEVIVDGRPKKQPSGWTVADEIAKYTEQGKKTVDMMELANYLIVNEFVTGKNDVEKQANLKRVWRAGEKHGYLVFAETNGKTTVTYLPDQRDPRVAIIR